jgi:hypothetical protein
MIGELPHSLIGTTRIRPAARSGFGGFLDAAAGEGPITLLTEGGRWFWEIARENGRQKGCSIWGLIPHVAGYVREATDYGMLGAGWHRLRRIHPLCWAPLCLHGLRNIKGVCRRDFPTLLTLLLEMEMASFRSAGPPVVFLHPQITDLLLAMDHAVALERAIGRLRRGFGAKPGLATNNLGTLLPRLRAWGLEVPYLLTPIHPHGYGMRPGKETCEDLLRSFNGQVIATLDVGLDSSIAAYWQVRGVASAVYDAPEPNLPDWERWKNRDKGTGRQGDKERLAKPSSVSLSPCLPVSLSGFGAVRNESAGTSL